MVQLAHAHAVDISYHAFLHKREGLAMRLTYMYDREVVQSSETP